MAMNSATRTVRITDPDAPDLQMTLEVPSQWSSPDLPEDLPPEVRAVLTDGGELTQGFATNVVVVTQALPAGTDLGRWQRGALDQQLSSLPDVQILEDRQTDAAEPTWYRARVTTGEGPATLLVREWSRIVAGRGMTLTLTTVPPVDAAHGELLDAVAASWRTTQQSVPPTPEENE